MDDDSRSMFKFRSRYFIIVLLLLLTEIVIALFVHDQFIRPNIGDFLVVILIYCFLQSFFNLPVIPAAISVLLFAYFIEMLQYLDFIERIGLKNSKLASLILGSSFEWADIVAYTAGAVVVIVVEKRFASRRHK